MTPIEDVERAMADLARYISHYEADYEDLEEKVEQLEDYLDTSAEECNQIKDCKDDLLYALEELLDYVNAIDADITSDEAGVAVCALAIDTIHRAK